MQIMLGQTLAEPTPAFTLSLGELLLGTYFIGAILMLLKLGNGLWNIFSMITNNEKSKSSDGTFVNTKVDFPASSFFSFIFWNNKRSLIISNLSSNMKKFTSDNGIL